MAQVIDPVCGMTIESASAQGRTAYQSNTYYFCSEDCLRAFRSDPGRYAGAERHEPPYTAGDIIAAPKFGSAGSGGLEHEMPPEMHDRE
jgi:YHS domain-containing protein